MAEAATAVAVVENVIKVVPGLQAAGPVFAIGKTVCKGLFEIGGDPNTQMLKTVIKGIESLQDSMKDQAKEIKLEVKMHNTYENIRAFCRKFSDEKITDKTSVYQDIANTSSGMRDQLPRLQEAIIKQGFISDSSSWIETICSHFLTKDNVPDDDFTWGLTGACKKFSTMLAFQRVAIEVLRIVMIKTKSPDPIENVVKQYYGEIDKQVESFLKEIRACWSTKVGDSKVLEKDSLSCYYGVYHDGEFYDVTIPSSSKEIVCDLVKFNQKSGKKIILMERFTYGKLPQSLQYNWTRDDRLMVALVSHEEDLWLLLPPLNRIVQIDPKSRSVKEYSIILDCKCSKGKAESPSVTGSMISHEEYLYIIHEEKLYQIDTDKLRDGYKPRILSDSWGTTSQLASSWGHLFIRNYGFFGDTIYEIDTTKTGPGSYKEVSGSWLASATITGHENYLYATSGKSFWQISPINYSYKKIGDLAYIPEKLYSHSLSIICIVNEQLVIKVRPPLPKFLPGL